VVCPGVFSRHLRPEKSFLDGAFAAVLGFRFSEVPFNDSIKEINQVQRTMDEEQK